MKVRLKLISVDLDTQERKILADGAALFDGERLLYQEKDTGAKHQIIWKGDCMEIHRNAEITSITTLCKDGGGKTRIIAE